MNSLLNGWNIFFWNDTADNLVFEFKAFAFFVRFQDNPHVTVLTTTACLANEFTFLLNSVANGFTVSENVDVKTVNFASYIPPTALVKATMKGAFTEAGELAAEPAPVPSAGAFQGVLKVGEKEITGTMRGRVLPDLPMKFDFETVELKETTAPASARNRSRSRRPSPASPRRSPARQIGT